MSTMLVIVSIWFIAIVAFVSGAAFCAFRRIRMFEASIRAPLQQRIDQQAEKLRRVQDVSAAHNFFLAGLSHELRTPLSGIQGVVKLLQNTELNSPQTEYTRMIAYASSTVLEIVDDMLTYSRMQAGKMHVESVSFSVREMIDDMLSLQTIKAQESGIALIRDVSVDVPSRLIGDRGKLNQILLNLIGNAIKFTEEGSVTVGVDIDCTTQTHARDPGLLRLAFYVRDTGIGMAEHEIEHLFEPFTQGYAATREGRQGTGLGLTICQRLIHAMDGSIRVDSVLHEGTCVTFDLVLERDDMPALPCVRSEKMTVRSPRSLVVLVVEDDEINRLVCTRYLALAGHHPVAAADERQVHHVMMHSGHVPDVILMDVNLAGQSGVELALQIGTQEGGHWQAVPVIAMSADVSGAAQEQARQGGISAFLPKPFSSGQLDAALAAAAKDVGGMQASGHGKDQTYGGLAGQSRVSRQSQITIHDKAVMPAAPDVAGQQARLSATGLLDKAWLVQEIDTLGTTMLLELLNIFCASAATTLQTMTQAAARQDWQAVADQLHNLQGSAANLGMQHVVAQARTLQTTALIDAGPHPAYMADRIEQLEVACHVSADQVRTMLLTVSEQGVALAT